MNNGTRPSGYPHYVDPPAPTYIPELQQVLRRREAREPRTPKSSAWMCPMRETCTKRVADLARRCGFECTDQGGRPLWRGCPTFKREADDDNAG